MTQDQVLIHKIKAKKASVAVMGLGYVGLPLAIEYAEAGFKVFGIEQNLQKVSLLKKGKSYIEDIDSARLYEQVRNKYLIPTGSCDCLAEVDVIIICVPTPLRKTKDPDLSFIYGAIEKIPLATKKPQLIVLESTTFPGSTEEIVLPRFQKKRKVGKDFFLVFSPERIDPGNKKFHTANIPKIVGGITPQCTQVAKALYEEIVETVIPVSSARVAEMVKLLENTFRSVNIGLVNEIALMCHRMGLDVWEVIDAAATKPFGFFPFYPGPGLGGHCLPVDPLYLSWKAKVFNFETRFIDLASWVNSRMPRYVVNRIAEVLNQVGKSIKGTHILILGVAYKKNVSDLRESPALDVIEFLRKNGAKITYHDPFVAKMELEGEKYQSQKLLASLIKKNDLTVILTDHDSVDYPLILQHSRLIFDTRNVIKATKTSVFKL